LSYGRALTSSVHAELCPINYPRHVVEPTNDSFRHHRRGRRAPCHHPHQRARL